MIVVNSLIVKKIKALFVIFANILEREKQQIGVDIIDVNYTQFIKQQHPHKYIYKNTIIS
jgi:hypothetical protein